MKIWICISEPRKTEPHKNPTLTDFKGQKSLKLPRSKWFSSERNSLVSQKFTPELSNGSKGTENMVKNFKLYSRKNFNIFHFL
jgi:hypothetical protein